MLKVVQFYYTRHFGKFKIEIPLKLRGRMIAMIAETFHLKIKIELKTFECVEEVCYVFTLRIKLSFVQHLISIHNYYLQLLNNFFLMGTCTYCL